MGICFISMKANRVGGCCNVFVMVVFELDSVIYVLHLSVAHMQHKSNPYFGSI